jgi:hypothetical protein
MSSSSDLALKKNGTIVEQGIRGIERHGAATGQDNIYGQRGNDTSRYCFVRVHPCCQGRRVRLVEELVSKPLLGLSEWTFCKSDVYQIQAPHFIVLLRFVSSRGFVCCLFQSLQRLFQTHNLEAGFGSNLIIL